MGGVRVSSGRGLVDYTTDFPLEPARVDVPEGHFIITTLIQNVVSNTIKILAFSSKSI